MVWQHFSIVAEYQPNGKKHRTKSITKKRKAMLNQFSLVHDDYQCRLRNEMASLPVVCSLILEPLPVALNTADFLAVVVGNRVRNRVRRRVHPESPDAVEELLLFLAPCKQRPPPEGEPTKLTIRTDILFRLLTKPQRPLPRNGPSSQPTAPHAAVAMPSTTIGSSPITCTPSDSRSWVAMSCTPRMVVAPEVKIDDPSEYLLRDARSLKNEFQSSGGASVRGVLGAVEFERIEAVRRAGRALVGWGRQRGSPVVRVAATLDSRACCLIG